MGAESLTRALRERARAAGFDACAVAAAGLLERDGAALRAWLASGRHAGMQWLARDPATRSDPRRLLEGCRSVVVLACNYWPGRTEARRPSGRGRVALYARGRDYHRVLRRRLASLAAWLDATAGTTTRVFVDTGPLLERGWAERAGFGWIGKNANLLTRGLGSWLLLGELVTTAELSPDEGPHADSCGSCTACLDACPTGAIVAEGVVDANLCISYWTIEHRGAVPVERRPGNGDWIFGCDVCQEVCPWNLSFARPATGDPFSRREDLVSLDPLEMATMDEATFRARFSGTALMRAKWEGMRRNACIVLGNRRRTADLPTLARLLDDADPIVAGHAAWAVARIGGPRGRHLLQRAAARESRNEVLAEIRDGLHRLESAS
jgi:epoxyqueuosine reductase